MISKYYVKSCQLKFITLLSPDIIMYYLKDFALTREMPSSCLRLKVNYEPLHR
jgi:hypothetical protein